MKPLGVHLQPDLVSLVAFAIVGAAVAILIGELARLAQEQASSRRVEAALRRAKGRGFDFLRGSPSVCSASVCSASYSRLSGQAGRSFCGQDPADRSLADAVAEAEKSLVLARGPAAGNGA